MSTVMHLLYKMNNRIDWALNFGDLRAMAALAYALCGR
jgi:hypothetical protein